MAQIYDRFMQRSEEQCLRAWREALLRPLEGSVLEVGAGTGANLALYPATLERLVLTEPDGAMRRKLERRARELGRDVRVLDAPIERLPFEAASFDALVSTLVLCSVRRQDEALAEMKRVLKPGGRLVFIEHVAAEPGARRRAWQGRLEPFWRRIAGNCHLTRETAEAIGAAGFVLDSCTRESMRKALPFLRPSVRGVARKPSSANAAP
jgi:ubiquinone/menaquinone biosynthesis C-methylase UbiE